MLYTVGAENGDWIMQGLDWTTGEVVFKYNVGSSRYNTAYSGVWLDQEGRLIHTTTYGVARYERLPD